jgi:hypothetical protein
VAEGQDEEVMASLAWILRRWGKRACRAWGRPSLPWNPDLENGHIISTMVIQLQLLLSVFEYLCMFVLLIRMFMVYYRVVFI